MAIDVNLYYFAKKINSTARPTNGGITYHCVIKEPCGILNPVIGLNLGLVSAPTSNYAYIPEFKRYYYVKEWTYQNALWYASLECDILASWKTDIGASTCYVLRSASASNGCIVDTTYPATGNTFINNQTKDSPWATAFAMGWFIVGIAGISTRYYLFTETPLRDFLGYIFSDSYAEQLTAGWSQAFPQLKAQCNPMQYITSIMWVPFTPEGDDIDTIKVGWGNVPVTNAKIVS
jgi:hypothetical protein